MIFHSQWKKQFQTTSQKINYQHWLTIPTENDSTAGRFPQPHHRRQQPLPEVTEQTWLMNYLMGFYGILWDYNGI
jgi:hypothetical protein